MGLSMAERRSVTTALMKRYAAASKTQKGAILDELCALTCWTEDATALEVAGTGSGRMLHATLRDADAGGGVAERVVRFYVDDELVGMAKTDPEGNAGLDLPKSARGSGRQVRVEFDGDPYFLGAMAEART